jgi:hypothetical protein
MTVLDKIAFLADTAPWITEGPLTRRLNAVLRAEPDGLVARRRVIQIATEVNEAISPVAACRRGCSHCCRQGLMNFEHEAVLLAEVSGREMFRQPWRRQQEVDVDIDSTTGKPCPFLVNDSCSVYEPRPVFCRLRNSLNEDPDDCAIDSRTGGQVTTYAADAIFIEPYVELSIRTSGLEPVGSIHRYFPER